MPAKDRLPRELFHTDFLKERGYQDLLLLDGSNLQHRPETAKTPEQFLDGGLHVLWAGSHGSAHPPEFTFEMTTFTLQIT